MGGGVSGLCEVLGCAWGARASVAAVRCGCACAAHLGQTVLVASRPSEGRRVRGNGWEWVWTSLWTREGFGWCFFSLEILFTLLCLATSAVDESCACAGVAGAADSLAMLPALGDAQRRNAAAAPCVCIAGALRLQSWRRRRSAHGRRSTAAGRPMWRPRDEVAGPPHPRRLCGRGVGACSAGVDQ